MSNIVGQIELKSNDSLNLSYDYLIDNNINQVNYHKL